MISDGDTECRERDESDITWTETNFLRFNIPEVNLWRS